jgi:phosphoribosylformylglycinamidine cyclo-ligase
LVRSTAPNGDAGTIGHFGGIFRLGAGPDRLLVASADGIGTKIKLAFVLGGNAHHQVGADLVNHCVNDILACGARPLFYLDYVAMGQLEEPALTSLVGGMAAACLENGVALIGGETAEMPGLYAPGEYDAAGFIVGAVEPDKFIDGSSIRPGDRLIGLPSTGLHTNGYSLARRILGLTGRVEHDLEILGKTFPGSSDRTLGDALMAPHPSYLPSVWPLVGQDLLLGIAHITGGGLIDNLPRILPEGTVALINRSGWTLEPIFEFLVEQGRVDRLERFRVFNMGVGMVLVVKPEHAGRALSDIPGSFVIGEIGEQVDDRRVILEGVNS